MILYKSTQMCVFSVGLLNSDKAVEQYSVAAADGIRQLHL